MANYIEETDILNPNNVEDTCSHIVVEERSDLIISDCMTLINTYAFQFWIKGTPTLLSDDSTYVCFTCDNTFKKILVKATWTYFNIIFTVSEISNIIITFPRGEFYIYNTKLEIGSHNTDWSPHPDDRSKAYLNTFEDIEQKLVSHQDSITRLVSLADQLNERITNTITKTTFKTEIDGIINNFDDKLQGLESGVNSWHVSIFDKTKFVNPNAEKDPDTGETDVTETRYDMSVFTMDNAKINPEEEVIVPDKPAEMQIYAKGRILYYIAFAKFKQDTTIPTTCMHGRCTLYINGTARFSSDAPGTDLLIGDKVLLFEEGMNIIEIVCNEGNFAISTSISKHSNCEYFNCLLGVPTSRTTKVRQQSAGIEIFLDKIISSVYETEDIEHTDKDGNVSVVLLLSESKIELLKNAIYMTVTNPDGTSELLITPTFIQSITQKFVVTSPSGNSVIIEDGALNADSITSDILNVYSIMSKNYVSFSGLNGLAYAEIDNRSHHRNNYEYSDELYLAFIEKNNLDLSNDNIGKFSRSGTYLDLEHGNFYSPSLYIDGLHNKAWFKGAIYADEGVFNGTVYATDGEFSGTVYATDGVFNGTVYATDGEFSGTIYATDGVFSGEVLTSKGNIGPWIIDTEAIYKGTNILGDHGNGNIYLGNEGFSLGDRLIYDSDTDSLMLSLSAITFAGTDSEMSIYGQDTWYSVGIPSDSTYPTNQWTTIEEKSAHLGNYYYDTKTRKVFVYKAQDSVKYRIRFDGNTDIKSNDYVDIYYYYYDLLYRVAQRISSNDSPDIIIPTNYFYLHWHTLSGGVLDHYGFAVLSFDRVPMSTLASVAVGGITRMPYLTVDRSLPNGTFPETDHPYISADQDKIWLVRAASENGDVFTWQEVTNVNEIDDVKSNHKSLDSFLHYDANNGLILFNSSANLENTVLTDVDLEGNVLLKNNIRIDENGIGFYNRNTLLAHFSNTLNFYDPTTNELVTNINSDGLNIKKGTISLGGLESLNFTELQTHGLYVSNDGSFTVGSQNSYIKFDGLDIYINATSLSFGNDGQDLSTTINGLEDDIGEAQTLINSSIQYYGDNDNPNFDSRFTIWNDIEKEQHLGNTYYNITNGRLYRFCNAPYLEIQIPLPDDGVRCENDIFTIYYNDNGTIKSYTTTVDRARYYETYISIYIPKTDFYVYYKSDQDNRYCQYRLTIKASEHEPSLFSDAVLPNITITETAANFYLIINHDYENEVEELYHWNIPNISSYTWVRMQDSEVLNKIRISSESASSFAYLSPSKGLILTNGVRVSSDEFLESHNLTYTRLDGNALRIYANGKEITYYGMDTYYYYYDGDGNRYTGAHLGSTGFELRNGNAGGIKINSSSMYSSEHASYDSTGNGFYFDKFGNFSVGNDNSYIRFTSTNGLEISIGGQAVEGGDSGAGAAQSTASEAMKVATNYLFSSDGLIVSPVASAYASQPYIKITTTGLDVYGKYNDVGEMRLLTSYGEATKFYGYLTNGTRFEAATLGSTGFNINSGSAGGINISNVGIYSGSHSDYNTNTQGFFIGSNGDFGIGNNTSYIRYHDGALSMALSSLSVGATGDIGTAISGISTKCDNIEKGVIYHGNGKPTNTNYPASNWTSDALKAENLNAIYCDDSTGIYYKYTQCIILGRQLLYGYRIRLRVQTESYSTADYVQIFYRYNGNTYYYKFYDAIDSIKECFVPASLFYVHWHTDSSYHNYYGYSIENVFPAVGTVGENTASLPSITATVMPTGTYPESAHNGYNDYEDCLYLCTPRDEFPSGTPSLYDWIEFPDIEVTKSATGASNALNRAVEAAKTAKNYLYYTASDGLVIHGTNGELSSVSSITGSNIRLTSSNGLGIYDGSTLLTSYGAETKFYKYGTGNVAMSLNNTGIHITSGSIELGTNFSVNSSGVLSCSSATIGGTITAGPGSVIGALTVSNVFNSVQCFYSGSRSNYNSHELEGVCIESNGNFGCGSYYVPNSSSPNNKYFGWFETSSGAVFACLNRVLNGGYSTYRYSLTWGCSLVDSGYDDTFEECGVFRLYENHANKLDFDIRGNSPTFSMKGSVYCTDLNIKNFGNSFNDVVITLYGVFGRYHDTNNRYSFMLRSLPGSGARFELCNDDSSNSRVFSVDNAGNVNANGTLLTSDIRLKNVVTDTYDYKALFMELNPITFTWKYILDDTLHVGISALDVISVTDKLGFENFNFIGYDAHDDKYYANYTEILMLSIPVVQEHEIEILKLKNEIESLKGEIKRLKGVM